MRALGLLLLAALLTACHGQTTMSGVYLNDGKLGLLFACDHLENPVRVPDSALAATYHQKVNAPAQPLFARLRGVATDSGSVYGSVRFLLVRQVLELRPLRSGECPKVTHRFAPTADSTSATPQG